MSRAADTHNKPHARGKAKARPPAPKAEAGAWKRKHLLGLEELSAEEITTILDSAESLKAVSTRSVKKVPALRGKVVVNLFFEESTRTRMSFALAAQRLSADVIDFPHKYSSVTKGETLRDTARNIEAMGVDFLVVRHPAAGAPHRLAEHVACSVINAGDGLHEHPTQGLIDLFTIREIKKKVAGLKVAIVGDIAHSRVARSNIWALTKLGAKVWVVGPSTLVSPAFASMGVTVSHQLNDVLPEMDVINMLRIQSERITSHVFPSVAEYTRLFGLSVERMKLARPDVLVMHPGPINRGIELAGEVADGPNSSVLRQVTNGLAVRMAVLFLLNQAASVSGGNE